MNAAFPGAINKIKKECDAMLKPKAEHVTKK
jgi:hypothetical protein